MRVTHLARLVRSALVALAMMGALTLAVPTTAAPATSTTVQDVMERHQYTGRWVLVNLSEQRIYAYEGNYLANSALVSTGLAGAKQTPTGSFWVQQRYRATLMQGPGYYLPDVPWTQYFGNNNMSWQAGYALHGTYWHSNFGTPMSSGCVNLNNNFAAWLWDWSDYGLPVEITY